MAESNPTPGSFAYRVRAVVAEIEHKGCRRGEGAAQIFEIPTERLNTILRTALAAEHAKAVEECAETARSFGQGLVDAIRALKISRS